MSELFDDLLEESQGEDHIPAISQDELSDHEVLEEINSLKNKLGHQVYILGHHYQQDDIIKFAHVTGDSLELARKASQIKEAEYIIFCGVHFMAETADMLTATHQKVILPDLRAGCSMADMAERKSIDKAWSFLNKSAVGAKIVPITYINCSADLKSFVGENEGSICTSSNAEQVIKWALDKGDKLLFFPDQHLGRNTCHKLGISLDEMIVYNPNLQNGGLSQEQVRNAKIILWYGYCSVHQGFNIDQVKQIKKNDPERCIIVHPECNHEVVSHSDLAGSTSFIINHIKKAKAGSKFAVGTEVNLVNRLAQTYEHLDIKSLSPYQCLCTTMYRVRPRWLLESLRSINEDRPINIIKVDEQTKKHSLKALDQMFSIS